MGIGRDDTMAPVPPYGPSTTGSRGLVGRSVPRRSTPSSFEGQIWKCAPLAYLKLQAKKYHLSDQWNPYLQYQPLRPDCTPDELNAFFAKQDEPCCSMCSSKPVPFELPLPFPFPADPATRRLAA